MRRRRNIFVNTFLNTMFYSPVSLVSHFRWLAYEKELARAGARFCLRYQGTLFFDVVRIIDARRPAMFVLENVKNLKSHDQGKTFRIIMQTLDELGYDVADAEDNGPDNAKSSMVNIFCRSTVNASCWWVFVAI